MLALFLVLPARQHYSWRTLWLFCTMDATFSARVHLTQPVQQLGQAVVVFSFGVLGVAFSQAKVRFETLGARYMVIFLWGWLRWLCVAGAALGARDGVFLVDAALPETSFDKLYQANSNSEKKQLGNARCWIKKPFSTFTRRFLLSEASTLAFQTFSKLIEAYRGMSEARPRRQNAVTRRLTEARGDPKLYNTYFGVPQSSREEKAEF